MEIERLIEDLCAPVENKRTSAKEKLMTSDPAHVLPKLAEVMLDVATEELVSACFDIIDHFEASAPMIEVRMDGWFDKIAPHISHFEEICEVMGRRFLAYSFILNIQVESLMLDPISPANTAVNFSIGDNKTQTLSLGEFKVRVVQTLIRDERLPLQPSLPFQPESAVAVLGGRNILLAPLFDISIERVMLVSLPPALPQYLVAFISPEGFNVADLVSFLELIRENLRQDLLGTESEPFSIDLYAVERAREAAKQGNHAKVVEILEAWPGILSVLQRSPARQNLADEQLQLIGEGVYLLGEALETEGQPDWSEELYKLGLQFVREGEVAARLFADTGKILVKKEGFGEAIGYLRRALFLGAPKETVLPSLAHAFLKRNCTAAAAALVHFCGANHYGGEYVEGDLAAIKERFEKAQLDFDLPLPESPCEEVSGT